MLCCVVLSLAKSDSSGSVSIFTYWSLLWVPKDCAKNELSRQTNAAAICVCCLCVYGCSWVMVRVCYQFKSAYMHMCCMCPLYLWQLVTPLSFHIIVNVLVPLDCRVRLMFLGKNIWYQPVMLSSDGMMEVPPDHIYINSLKRLQWN